MRLSSEVLKRTYSPTFCSRSASTGLRSQVLNGPLIRPLGPFMMASAMVRCAGVIFSSVISGMRSPVRANAEPANKTLMVARRKMAFMERSLFVAALCAFVCRPVP